MDLNGLYNLAAEKNIIVDCFDMKNCECVSLIEDGECYISIDPIKIASHADEKVKLAHELGHCETGAFYNEYATCDIRGKHECRAVKWAIKKLVPKDELINAFNCGMQNNYELAEYFGVTEDFMRKVIKYYCD